ncbi:hypothetical protein N0V94_002803, partial [Neodidymelliopsis sp. IMI 364377]
MESQRNKFVMRDYSGFDMEDIQYLIGTRLPNSITEWKFPTQAERDTRGAVFLIGNDINGILRQQFPTDASLHQLLGVLGVVSPSSVSRSLTGYEDSMSILTRTSSDIYTYDDAIPPPQCITHTAATIVTALEQLLVSSFDSGAPAYTPYGCTSFVAVSRGKNAKISLRLADYMKSVRYFVLQQQYQVSSTSLLTLQTSLGFPEPAVAKLNFNIKDNEHELLTRVFVASSDIDYIKERGKIIWDEARIEDDPTSEYTTIGGVTGVFSIDEVMAEYTASRWLTTISSPREPTDKATLIVLEFDEEDEELHAIVVQMRNM